MNKQNVIVRTPCESGKTVIEETAIFIKTMITGLENGVGLCLEPLNNILYEKSSDSGVFRSAHLTMTGESLLEGNAVLSCSMDDALNGAITCIYGHPESFMSSKGTLICQLDIFIYVDWQ